MKLGISSKITEAEDSYSTVGEGVTVPFIKRTTEPGLSFGEEQVKNVSPGVRTRAY